MFIAALLEITEIGKQPKGALTDEWISKIWYIHTVEYQVVLKKEILQYGATWMNLEHMKLNEISQLRKGRYCTIQLIRDSKILKFIEAEGRRLVARGLGVRENVELFNDYNVSFLQDK